MVKGPDARHEGFKGKTSAEPTLPKALPPHTLRQRLPTVEAAKVHVCPAASLEDKENRCKSKGCASSHVQPAIQGTTGVCTPAFASKLHSQVHSATCTLAARLTAGKNPVNRCRRRTPSGKLLLIQLKTDAGTAHT